MLIPIAVSSVFVLALSILCVAKPNTGRNVLGLFFLGMALGVNGHFTFTAPQSYVEYASGALIPFYRNVALAVVRSNPVLFGSVLIIFEIAMGTLLLHKHSSVKIGLIGTMGFLIGISPLSFTQIPWVGLAIAQAYLLTKEFDTSFFESIQIQLLQRRTYQNEE